MNYSNASKFYKYSKCIPGHAGHVPDMSTCPGHAKTPSMPDRHGHPPIRGVRYVGRGRPRSGEKSQMVNSASKNYWG